MAVVGATDHPFPSRRAVFVTLNVACRASVTFTAHDAVNVTLAA